MKDFFKCLTIVAFVALISVSLSSPKATSSLAKPKPKVIASVIKPVIAPVAVAPITYPIGCANYLSLVDQYNWNTHVAMAIMQAESSCNPYSVSNVSINYDGVADYGLMQLHGVDILDPAQNVAYAYYHKYLPAHGFTPWSTYNSGAYTKYLQ
jgi:soluble lytic murein transglycosylase-like protein